MNVTLPKNVAYVAPGWPEISNGIVTYTRMITGLLEKRGVRCHVLARRIREGAAAENVHDVPYPGREPSRLARLRSKALAWAAGGRAISDRQFARRIVRAASRIRARDGLDLLQMEESFGWARHVIRPLPIPVVVRLHGPWFLNGTANGADPSTEAYRARVAAEGEAIRAAAAVTAPSQDVLERTREHYGLELPNAVAIPNPVGLVPDGLVWKREKAEPGLVLFAGRFDLHKGGDLAVDAFEQLAARRPDVRMVFAGGGHGVDVEGGRLQMPERLDRLPAPIRVRLDYRGRVPREELAELRCRAAVTLVPSRYENFANTALEAVVQGCPVVMSNTGGLPEIVTHEENGLLCRPGSVEALAVQVERILDDPTLAASLGRKARETALDRFHPDRIARLTLEFYSSVMHGEPARSVVGKAHA